MVKTKSLNERIKRLEATNYEGIEKAQRLSREEALRIQGQRVYEKLKFDQFKKIVENEQYFRIDHFKKLNIKYDILIHLSAKNAGKTTELYRCIKQCLKKGEKFIYGRVTTNELVSEIEKFNYEKLSPVYLLTYKNRFYFFNKTDINSYIESKEEEDSVPVISYANLTKADYSPVGLGMTFMNSNTLGGGNYENYTTIFFDEIVSYQPKEYINEKILYNWGCAVSTILRNKKELTIIMMGNLRNGIDRIPILDYYGIDIADDLRVIKRSIGDKDDPCTILYVNSGSLYKNTLKNQASIAHHATLEDRLFMEHNKVVNTSTKILTKEIAEKMNNVITFAITFGGQDIVLSLRQTTEEPIKYCLSVAPLTITTNTGHDIYSDSIVLLNKYSFLKWGVIQPSVEFMYLLCCNNVLYYDSNRSLNIGAECIVEMYFVYQRLNPYE